MRTIALYVALAVLACVWMGATHAQQLPEKMACEAQQTAGFHDYPHNAEAYESVVFFESSFTLKLNRVLMQHLPAQPGETYLIFANDEKTVELTCRQVRGVSDQIGLSCSNNPPSEMLLINARSLRFTRTSIGGWTFTGADENTAGDSIFVEYGVCEPG